MRIVWVGDEDDFRRGVTESLQSAGHIVRHAHGDATAIPLARQEAPHVVLVAPRECNDAALDLVIKLREEGKPPPHVLLVAKSPAEDFLVRAYQNGLDGEVGRERGEAYVRARIDSLERRLDPNKKAVAPAKPGGAAVPPLEMVVRSGAWRNIRPSFGDAVGKFLALGASVAEVPIPAPELSLGCEIVLASAAQELELRVAIAVDATTAKTLAVHLFGDEADGLEGDMMNEIANICMGTVKTALSAEAFSFAAGLPKVVTPDLVLRPAAEWKMRDSFAIRAADATVMLNVGLRSKANAIVALGALVEGMVLAKDVYNPRGMLLLTAGTRLSLTMVEKLQGMLPPKQMVEVSGG